MVQITYSMPTTGCIPETLGNVLINPQATSSRLLTHTSCIWYTPLVGIKQVIHIPWEGSGLFYESLSKIPTTYLVTLLPATHCDSPVLKLVRDRSVSRIDQRECSHVSSVPVQHHMCNCIYYSSVLVSMLSCSFLCIVLICTMHTVGSHALFLVSFHSKSN